MSYEAELAGRYAGARKRLGMIAPPKAKVAVKPRAPRIPESALAPWPEHEPIPSYRTILREVAAKHNTTVAAIIGGSHARSIMPARRQAAARMYLELGMSLTSIGERMNRDHTTILHMLRKAAVEVPELAALIEQRRMMADAERELKQSEAMRYCRMGLSRNEIARLTDLNPRIVTTIMASVREAQQ